MSYKLGDFTYGFVTYVKSAAAFLLLRDYMGSDLFNRSVREFLLTWKGLHPTPYDLFAIFNRIAGEDLAWFWKPWFFEFGYSDLAVGAITPTTENNRIEILNKGGYPVPVKLVIDYDDGTTHKLDEKMSCWKGSPASLTFTVPPGKIKSVRLNPELVPEKRTDNN
jgi:aminopeptidase N